MAGGKRFIRVYEQGTLSCMEIWVDTVTGVHYLCHQSGNAGGMTPLLDRNGHVVVSMPENPVENWK